MGQLPHGAERAPIRDLERGSDLNETGEGIRTFLVADVRGYTLFTHERGDEAAARLAARFAAVVREQVESRGGSVIELRGDEALATFRSPRQAIRAAVELQCRFLEETRAAPDLPLPVGIGLDAGEAVPVAGGYRGGALNLAARLCGEAGPGETLASQSLVHLARTVEGVRYIDRGGMHLKGLSDPVHVLAISPEKIEVAEEMRSLLPRPPGRRAYGGKMQFRVLGPLEVDPGSGPIPLGGPKQRGVLAHLLIRANELVPAEILVDEIWGDEPPEKSRNIVQTYVSHLRKLLGHDRIQSQGSGYRLRVDPSELDAARFDALVRDAQKALPLDPNIAVGTLEDALALWRGPALADLADRSSLLAEAARLDDLRLEAQEARIEGLLATGAQARAIGELEVLLARNPLRESLWSLLMVALYREGRQAEALQAYQRAREILAEELGIDPSPELARLHERVLKQDPGLDLRGQPLRGYRLLEKIGEGRTGVVFRAIQPRVGRDVAVKIFHERMAVDAAFVRRFEPEAQAAAGLEHPHIAPIHDYWREPGRAYVVSRYFRGGSLRGLEERGGSLAGDRGLRTVEQIASALAFAHRQGVTHGNLGSSNVLFDAEGNAYLGDFQVGGGPNAGAADDLRGLAGIVRRWVPKNAALEELAEQAQVGRDGLDAGAFADAARTALEPGAVAHRPRIDERNPYKGLRPFTEADARDFFGRGELTHRLVARLNEAGPGSRFLAVVGPSGAGKSSLVRAGLVPAIRGGAVGDAETSFIAEMFPGAHPLEELEAALLRIAMRRASRLHGILDASSRGLLEAVDLTTPEEAEVVLVVDQFEEVFTLTTDERERELFLESLRVATADPDSRLRVIVTLRADFYDRPLIYPRFGELLAARTEAVPPLTPDELEQAIRGPAEQVGIRPEPGLVAEMIADVAHQPGALPLLQYALTELFERRDDGKLTLPAYSGIGGVAGALSARADRIYEAADPVGRRAIKQVFLRLVTLGEGKQDTRRRVARSELDSLEVEQEAIDRVLEAFGRYRLLTFDREPSTREPTVEIAHEALLSAWEQLRTWIDDAREDLRQDRGLAQAAAEWRGSGKDQSFLLRGMRLEQIEGWAATTDLAIGRPERAYLKASIDRRERERAEDEARRERERRIERRSRSRLRALVAVLGVAALVAASLTVVATNQSGRAEREARISTARELAAASRANLDLDPERSVLLAIEAVKATRSFGGTVVREAEEALHDAVLAQRVVLSIQGTNNFDYSPDGRRLIGHLYTEAGVAGDAAILDAETGETLMTLRGRDEPLWDVDWSPRGNTAATVAFDGVVTIWDPDDGHRMQSIASPADGAGWVEFSPDGEWIASTSADGTARIWDVSSGHLVTALKVNEAGGVLGGLAWSPDGERIAVVPLDEASSVEVWDVGSGRLLWAAHRRGGFDVAWSPNGNMIVTNGGTVDAWDARTGGRLFTLFPPAEIYDHEFSPDGHLLAGGAADGTTRVWEITPEGGREILVLPSDTANICCVTFSPDGRRLATGNGGFTAGGTGVVGKIWDVTVAGGGEGLTLPRLHGGAGSVAYSPDGSAIAIAHRAGFTVWDATTGERLRTVRTASPVWGIDFGPDRTVIAASGEFGAGVWDTATGSEQVRFEGHRGWVPSIDVSTDGTRVVTSGADGTARIWDATSGKELRTLLHSEVFDPAARFSPDGRLVVTMEREPGVYQLRDAWTGEVVRTLGRSDAFGRSVALSPDGQLVAGGLGDGTLSVWAVSGHELYSVPAHAGEVTSVTFDAGGARVATGGTDGLVKVWDARTGANLLTLTGHSREVFGLAFSTDGAALASSASDGIVRVWILDLDELLRVATERVTRGLTNDECRQYMHEDRCSHD